MKTYTEKFRAQLKERTRHLEARFMRIHAKKLLWWANQKKALGLDNHQCRGCGSGKSIEVHHIQYRSAGGSDNMGNLIVLCRDCHNRVHGRIVDKETDPANRANRVKSGRNYMIRILRSNHKPGQCFRWKDALRYLEQK